MSTHKFYDMDQSPLFKLHSKSKLADLLYLTNSELRSFERKSSNYREWDEPKKNGGFRHIENPERELKRLQKRLAKYLSRIQPPDHLFCPVKRRSFVDNAQVHAKQAVVRTLDIKNYFPSTSSKRVFWFWHKRMKCARNIAGLLTKLSCYEGHLPTGSPLSPILSFYAHIDIWEEIAQLAQSYGCKITVYIDDVTISGNTVPDKLIWEIKKRIAKAGLMYHKEKDYRTGWAEVTGIINRDGKSLPPNRTLLALHNLRKEIRIERDPKVLADLIQKLKSYQTHIEQIQKTNTH